MKKISGALVICLLAYGVYYAYKHKNRFIYRFSDNKNEMSVDDYRLEIARITKKFEDEKVLSDGLNEQVIALNDTIFNLKQELKRLRQKPEQPAPVKVIKTNQNPLSIVNNKPTNKNEKNLPIARGRDAVELKEFFTDRYDHR